MANVGYATLQIIPSAKGFASALEGQVAPGMTAMGASGGKKFGGAMMGSLKAMVGPLAAAAGGAAAVQFLKGAITGASDLNETVTKTAQIFGKEAMPALEKFAASGATTMGQTKQQVLDAASTFAVFGKSAGLTGKGLTGFSTKLVGLSGDLASFYNTSPEEAIQAIGAALRGESEPIRKYGVLLDDASLKQEALRQGIIKTTKGSLTPQQRVLAAQALILQQTTDAQGDFAKTSGGLANQQRILAAQFGNLKVQIGGALLPVVLKLVTAANTYLIPLFNKAKTAVAPLVAAFQSAASSMGGATGLGAALTNTGNAIKGFVQGLLPTLTALGQKAAAVLLPAFKKLGDTFTNTLLPAFQKFLPVIQPLAAFLLNVFGGAVIGALSGVIKIVDGVMKILAGLFNLIRSVVSGDWSGAWDALKTIASGALQAIIGFVQFALNVGVLKAFRTVGTLITSLFTKAWVGIKSAASSGTSALWGIVKQIPAKILGILKDLPASMATAGMNMVQGLMNGLGKMLPAVGNFFLSKLPGWIVGPFKKALGIASPSKVFKQIGTDIGAGFIKGIQGTQDKIRDTMAKLADDVKKTGNKKLIAAVADAQKKLATLGAKRDLLRDQYAQAQQSLADLKKQAADYAKSVSEAVVATGNISAGKSFTSIVRGLSQSLTKAKAFSSALTQLRAAGLNQTALQQLVDAGPQAGLASAQAILSSGQAGIATLNELQAQLKAQGDAIGSTISDTIYSAAIKDSEKTVATIGAQLTVVEKQIVGVGAALAKEIAKIGKIAAPSWLKQLVAYTDLTVKTTAAPKKATVTSPKSNAAATAAAKSIVVNNYNPVAEPSSVTVSKTLTRLAFLEI